MSEELLIGDYVLATRYSRRGRHYVRGIIVGLTAKSVAIEYYYSVEIGGHTRFGFRRMIRARGQVVKTAAREGEKSPREKVAMRLGLTLEPTITEHCVEVGPWPIEELNGGRLV